MHKILANTIFLGKDLVNLTECHSTNSFAASMIKSGQFSEGTVIVAEVQTKGRGQRNNSWHAAPGLNLTFSIIFKPNYLHVDQQFDLNMAMAFGVLEVLQNIHPKIQIKWPNDFLDVNGNKLGGMLIENTISGNLFDTSIVGIGINVNQMEFPVENAISLAGITGKTFDLEWLLEQLLVSIEKQYLLLKNGSHQSIKDSYMDHLFRMGVWASYDDGEPFIGKILGVGPYGHLSIMKQNGKIQSYDFKQIKFI
ncbi:biotin--[acetyl-CoA-carboxylase] ligase [Cyclobacterium plantarum]|uniref:Biotin--[acetyl-CoA-carboxylase] ligase n=1 Tax=Cyclobacterium plantarum TaxID=2716263 RepID=A0ABX0H8E4_9BACT|nr:biotin--[acetyl-CoA-carboxylase] ligase [Cyclobacterium plantarum]NHE58154.1 biotin--[acetyl-CoA-carboxylase] ligase [Cyclobacterium plantarum]